MSLGRVLLIILLAVTVLILIQDAVRSTRIAQKEHFEGMADTGGTRRTQSSNATVQKTNPVDVVPEPTYSPSSTTTSSPAATYPAAAAISTAAATAAAVAAASPPSNLKPVVRTSAERELTFDSLGGYSFDTASDDTVAFDTRPVVRFADGTTDSYKQPPATKQNIPLKPEHVFTSADANSTFANNLFQSQFGEINTDPSDDLLPKYTTSDMADALSMYDNIELSQEDLIDLSTQCQGMSTVMQSGSKPTDIRGSIGAPRGVNTGPWLQNSVNGVTDVRGIC
jgi:hypothetical protein